MDVIVCVGPRCQNVTAATAAPLFAGRDAWVSALPPSEGGTTCLNHALHKQRSFCELQPSHAGGTPRCPQCTMPDASPSAYRLKMSQGISPVRDRAVTELTKQRLMQRGRLKTILEASVPQLSCSSSRGADRVIISSFFSDIEGRPLAPIGGVGHFLEIGGYDGYHATNTWYLERCLGWRGVLVEPDPGQFTQLHTNRPRALTVNAALCATHTAVTLFGERSKSRIRSAIVSPNTSHGWNEAPRSTACGPLGDYLRILGVARVDFFSLDVEGAEEVALASLLSNATDHLISFGVLLVEARHAADHTMSKGLTRTRDVLRRLGLTFAGQVAHAADANATHAPLANQSAPMDEVWVNESHIRHFFPRSFALTV